MSQWWALEPAWVNGPDDDYEETDERVDCFYGKVIEVWEDGSGDRKSFDTIGPFESKREVEYEFGYGYAHDGEPGEYHYELEIEENTCLESELRR